MTKDERKSLSRYQRGNDVLQPLRYHIHQLIEAIESDNRLRISLARPPVWVRELTEAKKASEKAERFFCTKEPKK